MNPISLDLERRRAQSLFRVRATRDSPQGVEVEVEGRRLLSFCSNDYLGLANHPDVIAAFTAGARRYGVGAGASHLISGHTRAHHMLEEELAAFVGSERALLFSTGYMANLGVVAALAARGLYIYEDRRNHASLIDAARGTHAHVVRYPHGDTACLAALIHKTGQPDLVTTDGVFSMDGDLAPLPPLAACAREHGAYLLVDDAHGVGVLGATGRGSFEHWRIPVRGSAILMGTLGKALGAFGAFVASDADVIETLIQRARTYIYTTALPPAVAEAARASVRIVGAEPWRRERLQALVRQFREGAKALGLALADSLTPIQPVVLGDSARALAASQHLRAAGILVPAIRPPTVPRGGARLRVTLCCDHTDAHVERLLDMLAGLPAPA